MSIEKIDQSLYFHPEINNTHQGVLDALSRSLIQDECVIFYRPRGPIRTIANEKSSVESSANNKVVLSEGGVESSISQVIVFQNNIEKNLIPFYCSKDQTCFALFHGKEIFKNLAAVSEWTAGFLARKEKSKKAYNLLSLMGEKPRDTKKHLSSESLQEIIQHINNSSLLNDFVVRSRIFPTKYTKKDIELITFGTVLTITAVSGLNLYLIKTESVFALIGEEELLALSHYQFQKKNEIKNDGPVAVSSSTTSTTDATSPTTNTTFATTPPFVPTTPFFPPPPEDNNSHKRKFSEITGDSTKTEQTTGAEQVTEEENPSKYLKTVTPME